MKAQLFALYDGELPGAARRDVKAHLASCLECREAYARWQRTARSLFLAPDIHPSDSFVHQLMERVSALERPRRVIPWWRLLRWLVPAVGLAGVLLLIIGPWQRNISLEALLLADGRESAPTQFVLASEPPTTDQVFGLIMEGQP